VRGYIIYITMTTLCKLPELEMLREYCLTI
jgi:hypothetical protein